MELKLYNSLTRNKDEFEPLKKGRVGIYVCGPTVYGHAHLGHAKSYVSFDVLVRYLCYLGYSVTYVQNITDVGHLTDNADEGEDKIAEAAKKEKKHPMALAEYYTRSYFEDMDKLNCVRPDISPRASGHITEQIEMVKTLLEKDYAYEVNGSVYFDVSKFKEYGKLSGRNIDEMLAGARVEVSPDKKAPVDFALWKKAEQNHIMQWPSPWGMGFPGWHLECSVMAMKYLVRPSISTAAGWKTSSRITSAKLPSPRRPTACSSFDTGCTTIWLQSTARRWARVWTTSLPSNRPFQVLMKG